MLTPEMFKQAVETSHEECKASPTGCIHADSMDMPSMSRVVEFCIANALTNGLDPGIAILHAGIHIGYRMRQIETDTTPIDPKKVN